MKKILILALILTLTLTSCTAVVKTEESIDDVKAEEKEEVKNETPAEVPEEVVEEGDSEEVKVPEEAPDLTKEPEGTPIVSEEKNYITPSENETEAIIADFGEVSEEALDAIIEGLTGGEALEFPPVPLN